jgi:hypothetical protein
MSQLAVPEAMMEPTPAPKRSRCSQQNQTTTTVRMVSHAPHIRNTARFIGATPGRSSSV